ncbi:hypothetical protein ASF40_20265 [Microbacterium sp. Leaf288]|uniref:tetratricopeptide repeat protein n=1 Tax=Microbacterium sp. Leaf288 TaxID=1736323 RepID=UPI0006FCB18C|nr:tetratricopeptide repeat protein [Microbacterium sp. Leaf288]KQP67701.1 hypothetical protein ASF40_20265 [Microbacterium sp. Leaf288]
MTDLLIALFGPVAAFSRWITLEMRVANEVSKRARAEGLRVNQRRLRRHLYATRFAAFYGDRAKRDELRASLDALTSGNSDQSARLFAMIEASLQSRASATRATIAVGASLHERLDSIEGAVNGNSTDDVLWDVRLQRLRPLRAETARDVRQAWPGMPTLIGLLDTGDKPALLKSWAARLPGFLADVPAVVYCWLADLAVDFAMEPTARVFLDRALSAGAHPLGYWEIRRLWLGPVEGGPALVGPTDRDYPLVRAHSLEVAGNLVDALRVINDWSPSTSTESATRDLLLARSALHSNDFDRAIELSVPLATVHGSPAGALIAGKALIARETTGSGSGMHADDLSRALTLLVDSRDAQRVWGYDSSAVVILASTAARLLNDPARALALLTASPDGEATRAEANSLAVRSVAALMLADSGILEPARALIDEKGADKAVVRQLRGLLAEAEGDREAAIRYLSESLELTPDFDQKGQLAVRLATMGHLHPFVTSQLEAGNEAFARNLKLMADAFADVPGGLERLRAAAHSSAKLTMTLSQVYGSRGDTANELRALTSAAERLGDATLWLVAANMQRVAGEHRDAIEFAQRARSSAPIGWGGRERVLGVLVESYAALGDWDQATVYSALLVQALPDNEGAIWNLITCQHHAGELDDALGTWNTVAQRRRPTTREQTRVWLALCQEYGEAIASVDDLVAVAAAWAGDEEIRRVIVGLVLLPARSDDDLVVVESGGISHEQGDGGDADANSDDREENRLAQARSALIADYFRDFPEGEIRQFTVDLDGDAGDLLDQISSAIGERPDTSDFDRQIFSGAFPLGLISLTHGATYAEAVVSHASGVRFASHHLESERASAHRSVDAAVVLDTTALFALSVLPVPLRTHLMSSFSNVIVAAEQYRDAVRGLQTIGRFGHAGPGLGQWNGAVAQRTRPAATESDRSDRARAASLVSLMRPLRRELPAQGFDIPDAVGGSDDGVWFAAAAVAGANTALWSDDKALNILAQGLGVRTFTTLGLVSALEEHARISDEDARSIRVTLLAERYMGIPFDSDEYREAFESNSTASHAIASVIEHLDGSAADEIVAWALSQAPSLVPSGTRLEVWISACVRWLVRISPDEASVASNLRLLATRIVESVWLVPQSFAFIDRGMVDGVDGRSVDPLVDSIGGAFRQLAQADRPTATKWLFDLIASLDSDRRPTYLGVLLRP